MLKAKLGALAASATLFATVFVPAASAANVNIGGNGAFSFNWANLTSSKTTSVSQSNSTTAVNNIGSNANSGNNSSMFNTGGASTVVSGPATSSVGTAVMGGSNNAMLAGCGCADATMVNIGGNGAFSVNGVNMTNVSTLSVGQSSSTTVMNSIGSNANSGGNTSMFNTNGGSTVTSGPAHSDVTTVTTGGGNNLTVTP